MCLEIDLFLIYGVDSYFFFQAEDGIRDYKVTGVQTCALPICRHPRTRHRQDQQLSGPRRAEADGPDGPPADGSARRLLRADRVRGLPEDRRRTGDRKSVV